jgi:hypothetical protein
MLPLSEPNKRGNTSKNWSAMLDALKKMLAWFAAMLTAQPSDEDRPEGIHKNLRSVVQ